MNVFEYKVVPAPDKGKRGKGIKGGPARFAHGLELLMNDLAADGWEYQRTDTLPSEERVGLTGRTTVFQNMLVFRRAKAQDISDQQVTALLTAPVAAPDPAPEPPVVPAPPIAAAPVVATDPAPLPKRDKSAAAAAAAAALRAQRNATRIDPPRGVAAE